MIRRLLQRLDVALTGARRCVDCGCTDHIACPGGCGWALTSPPVCTSCFEEEWPGLPGGCPGGGVDDLCAVAQGLDPFEDGCGLCTLGLNPELIS